MWQRTNGTKAPGANPVWGIGAMVCLSVCLCVCLLVYMLFSAVQEALGKACYCILHHYWVNDRLITNTSMQLVMYTKSTYSVFVYTFIKNTGTHLVSRKSAFSPIWCLFGCLSVCQWNCLCLCVVCFCFILPLYLHLLITVLVFPRPVRQIHWVNRPGLVILSTGRIPSGLVSSWPAAPGQF